MNNKTLLDIFEVETYKQIRDFIIKNPSDGKSKSIIEFMYASNLIPTMNLKVGPSFEYYSEISDLEYTLNYLIELINDKNINHSNLNTINEKMDKDELFKLFELFDLYSYREIVTYVYINLEDIRSKSILRLLDEFNVKDLFLERKEHHLRSKRFISVNY